MLHLFFCMLRLSLLLTFFYKNIHNTYVLLIYLINIDLGQLDTRNQCYV